MINSNRLQHIISVARLMKDVCIKNNCTKEYTEEMFTLGFVHDIGYEFCEHADHNFIGADFLERQNYKYQNEVRYHGVSNCDYRSKELDLLNWADMHTNGCGDFVTFQERLEDIANRRGKDSDAYTSSEKIIKGLIEKNYL